MTGAHGILIREASIADAEAIIDVYPHLFEEPGSPPPGWDRSAALERLKQVIEAPESAILVAENDGLAGICSVYIDINSVRYGQRCWVEDLVVLPGRRSQRVGERLLAMARLWAQEMGASHLELDSGLARTDAHRFYDRQEPAFSGLQYTWWVTETG